MHLARSRETAVPSEWDFDVACDSASVYFLAAIQVYLPESPPTCLVSPLMIFAGCSWQYRISLMLISLGGLLWLNLRLTGKSFFGTTPLPVLTQLPDFSLG